MYVSPMDNYRRHNKDKKIFPMVTYRIIGVHNGMLVLSPRFADRRGG